MNPQLYAYTCLLIVDDVDLSKIRRKIAKAVLTSLVLMSSPAAFSQHFTELTFIISPFLHVPEPSH